MIFLLLFQHYILRNLLRVLYEAAFGWSVDRDSVVNDFPGFAGIAVQKYKIQKKDANATGIQQKICPSDLLTQYLNPQFGNGMGFQHLRAFNDKAIKRLKKLRQTSVTASKISLILNLNMIIDQYIENEKPLEQAKQFFKEYIGKADQKGGVSDLIIRKDYRILLSWSC